MFLQIANPRPNAQGVLRTRISLYHAERHIRNNRAVRVNDNMQLDPDGAWLAFRSLAAEGSTVTQEWLSNRCIQGATPIKARIRTQAEVEADQRAINLWPVIPNYTEGRPMEDFLTTAARAQKASKLASGDCGER